MTTPEDRVPSESDQFTELLEKLGASEDLIADALDSGKAGRLAGDLVLAHGANMNISELASNSGIDQDKVASIWRDLGINAQPDDRRFGEGDLEVLKLLVSASELEIRGAALLRVIGAALGTVADAAVSHYVQDVEDRVANQTDDPIERARDLTRTIDFAFRIGDSLLGPVLAQHLRDAVARQRTTQQGVSDRIVARLAIGFVDLVGSTRLANRVSSRDLLETIAAFEAKAFDVASACGGRIVKHVGDEVMFMALSVDIACGVGLSMIEQFAADSVQPRGGIAFGEVITYHGDYYGPVVNLASRLTDLAVPGEILVDTSVRSTSGSREFGFESAGRRLLKGFDDPVQVFSLSRTPGLTWSSSQESASIIKQ